MCLLAEEFRKKKKRSLGGRNSFDFLEFVESRKFGLLSGQMARRATCSLIIKICSYIHSWNILQGVQVTKETLRFYARLVEEVAREAFGLGKAGHLGLSG